MDATPLEPMEAKLVDAIPEGGGWQFEPKWDGFRCLAVKQGGSVALYAKSGKPLTRYFPDVAAALAALPEDGFILDGELVVPVGGRLAFDALQMRLHPAESRVRKLAGETPALLILFDALTIGGRTLADEPLNNRRGALEAFFSRNPSPRLRLSPVTRSVHEAQTWLRRAGGALDGVIGKRVGDPYAPGERAMIKVKRLRTADCVVGGFRHLAAKPVVGSLLLGLYDREARLNHVGFCSNFTEDRTLLTRRLEPLIEPPGFTGDAPGGPSRWSTERTAQWLPLKPELVVEVRYDHVTAGRFRHGTTFVRWRPDKAPRQCRMDQLEAESAPTGVVARALAVR
jgi:ATP-dependent DNA ligase